MKITSDNGPDHWKLKFKGVPLIRVNGEKVKGVCEADDVAGYVILITRDSDGKIVIDREHNAICHHRIEGHVTIEGERRA